MYRTRCQLDGTVFACTGIPGAGAKVQVQKSVSLFTRAEQLDGAVFACTGSPDAGAKIQIRCNDVLVDNLKPRLLEI